MSHLDPFGFHWVLFGEVVVGDGVVVEVGDFLHFVRWLDYDNDYDYSGCFFINKVKKFIYFIVIM